MFKNDYILDMAEGLGRALGKTVKQENDEVIPIAIESMSDKDIILIRLKRLIHDNQFDEAENTLFKFLEDTNNIMVLEIGEWFYQELLKKSDDELQSGNFTTNEIKQGLADFKKACTDKFGV